MGVTFPPDLRIAGYRPALFKQSLLAFRRTHSPTRFVELKGVFGNTRDGAIVFEECLDRGLIVEVDGRYELSRAGEAIAGGKARKRTRLADAIKVVDQMLDRAQALNIDPDGVRFIDQIWLFGSAMREEETVGDLDMAVVSSRRPHFKDNWAALTEHVKRMLDARDDAPQVRYFPWSGEDWLTERALFGPRRHHLLAGVQSGTSDLELLGVPCRLIFDRARGGRVDDEVVARHPKSHGRSNEVDAPRTMPDLTPAPLRPMDARWVASYERWGMVHPYRIFGEWGDAAHALFLSYPEGLRVAGDGHELFNVDWVPNRVARGCLDGRDAIAVFNRDFWGGISLVLRRKMGAHGAQLDAWFEAPQLLRVRSQFGPRLLNEMASTIALILAADAERMISTMWRHDGKFLDCHRDFGGELAGALRSQLLERLSELLTIPLVRIAPSEWTGPAVDISIS